MSTRRTAPRPVSVDRGDDYVFHAGTMGGHNIIIATLPAGQEYGTGSAAALVGQVKKFFPNLWFGLFVGVAAGLPDLSRVCYGPIGSGDKLLKNAQKRNELRKRYGMIGLEMEAAGTMNRIPVGVIRGVYDYGDRHKNKDWQSYAAAMAASYARALLDEIPPSDKSRAPTLPSDADSDLDTKVVRETVDLAGE
jgi:hypothetical protein